VLLRFVSRIRCELGLGLVLVLVLGLGFRVQRCADPEILGPCQSTDSDQRSASAAVRNRVSAVSG